MKRLLSLKSKIGIFFTLALLLCCNPGNAQVEYVSSALTGANINTSSTLFFPDPLSCTSPTSCGNFIACSYLSYVALEIDPLSDPNITYLSGVYTIDVDLTLDYVDNSGNPVVGEAHTLSIGFNKDGGTFVNKDRALFNGGYGANLSITSVTYKDPNDVVLLVADIPTEASLFLGSLIDRYEPISLTVNPSVISYPSSYDHFIDLSWTDITGAASYDLEWIWVDTELADVNADQFNFKYNSTRINTENTNYTLSNIYRKGALIARVRGIGRTTECNEYLASPWTRNDIGDFSNLNSSEYILLDGHNEEFNWQHSRTYAEEGKHKDVITYFDGTMRSRQSVSRLESDDHAIVSENYYDHVGRATVQALPSPFIQGTNYAQNIDYYDNFNTANGDPYNRNHFEKDDVNCVNTADPMDASGAGQYYSSSNTITDGHQAYLPDALGYPFTQTIFTQDQTGRIRFQGGVGNTHQIGQGHETKFYYGVPEQEEIDRLFGNDVGYAQYYEKNLVVDVNGQVSVSYLDNKNRVIATALAGAAPTQLDTLPSYNDPESQFTINSDLSPLNSLNNEGTPGAYLSINKQFTVSEDGTTYTYDYALTPQDYTDPECAPDICFDCAYELKLVVYDECGNVVMKNDLVDGLIQPDSIDGDCEVNADHTFTLSDDLNIGSYGLNKKLSLDNETMNAYEELYVEAYQCIMSEVEIFNNLISNADLTGCVDQACLALCTAEVDILNYEDDLDGYVEALSSCLEAKIASGECIRNEGEDINQCGAFKEFLLADMSPFGQYGTVTNPENEIQRFDLPCTSFYAESNIFGISYDDPSLNYNGIMVDINGAPTSPRDLSLSQFVAYFESTWLTEILPLHPEYAYLTWCEIENVASDNFDQNLLEYTADEAEMNGYLNPLGHNPTTIGYAIGGTNGVTVSGALVSNMPSGDETALRNEMSLFLEFDNGTVQQDYSIWDVAYIVALSNILDVSQILADSPPAPGTWDDIYGTQLCRSDRFWEVFRAFYASLKLKHSQDALANYINNNATQDALDILNNNCIGSTGTCEGCDQWEVIQRRHFGYGNLVDDNGDIIEDDLTGNLDYSGIFDNTVDPGDETNAQLLAECQNICASYRDQWTEELQGCGFTTAELDVLLDNMESICASGCDPTHLLGASNSPDNSQSFKMALETALQGTPMSEFCSDLLITIPPPYGTDIFGGSQPFIGDCVCDRYSQIFDEYSVGQTNPDFDGFYTYLQNTYEIDYESEVLLDLDCACRNVDSPYLLDNPTGTFGIPEPFACVACIDCDQAADLYQNFVDSDYNYFGDINSETLENPNFRAILTTWLNQELNFNLSFNEYIDFFAYCGFGVVTGGSLFEEGTALLAVPDHTLILLDGQLVRRDDPEYQAMIGWMANNNLTFELKANQQTTQAGGTVTYDVTITNTGPATINFDYYDQLPGGWSFDAYPTNLNGGTLNTTTSDIMSVSGISLNADATILWTISTTVTEQAYIARKYYHQARIIETTLSPPDTTYSDDPSTTEAMDPTGIFLEVNDPCLGPVEEADDLVAFLNEIIGIVGNSPTYPIEIPLTSLTTFGPNSSLNLWPYLNFSNIKLVIPDPATTAGEITLMFINDCGVEDLLCAFTLDGIGALSDITTVHDASTLGVTNTAGNFVLQLDITTSEGIETTILAASSCYSLVPCDKRRLCNRSITFDAEPADNCLDYIFDLLALQATTEYETLIDKSRERFRLGYSLQCLGTNDQLDQTYISREYHHTLYYYDQSGTLVRTVPPKGVDILDAIELANVESYRDGSSSTVEYPEHGYRTDYLYNSHNKAVLQDSPDATEMEYYYDRLGRVVVSQDGRQRDVLTYPNPRHTYTIYDKLGRAVETGEIIHAPGNPMTGAIAFDQAQLDTWLATGLEQVQVIKHIYDENLEDTGSGLNIDDYFNTPRVFLRKRISSSLFFESYTPGSLDYDHASHYDYDVHGNVKTLIQEFISLKNINQQLKYFEYDYDLVSGNIHQISYQKGKPDAFYHRYLYDADNRITNVFTSHDALIWDKDVSYEYYDHKPLARVELGEYGVQGCDYAYTIQGWVKGVNSNTLIESRDIGEDGKNGGSHEFRAPDVYGYSLGYYSNDYISISTPVDNFLATEPDLSGKDLFNGNVRSMVSVIKKLDGSNLDNIPNVYTFDQLHRIKSMQKYSSIDETANSWNTASPINDFNTNYTYDPNGNLLSLSRRNNINLIDDLAYDYPVGGNQLDRVDDLVANGVLAGDIDAQLQGNYSYDPAGNLTIDVSESIADIEWNVQGKVLNITRDPSTNLSEKPNVAFQYDAQGNRVVKRVEKGANPSDWSYTYYVQDAKGNVMAIYEGKDNSQTNSSQMEDLFMREFHIHGKKRHGIKQSDQPNEDLENLNVTVGSIKRVGGHRSYEMSNHLGNIHAVISDNKLLSYNGNALPLYKSEMLSYSDYYPFGWTMPDRNESNVGYRYGFQGQEKDDEIKGEGNSINYKFRMHDPRVGRFFAIDPLAGKYPYYTPYSFSGNKVVAHVEMEGLEERYYNLSFDEDGNACLDLDKEMDLLFLPDVHKVTLVDVGISYTFQRYAWSGNTYDSFEEFQNDPIEAILSGKFVTDQEIMSDMAVDVLLSFLMRGRAKKPNKKLGAVQSGKKKMPDWLKRIRQGIVFQNKKLAQLKKNGVDHKGNIRLVPKNGKGAVKGNQTDADALIRNKDGTYTIKEYKLTSKTKLSPGQNASKKNVEKGNQEFEVRSDIPEWNLKKGDKIKVTGYDIETND